MPDSTSGRIFWGAAVSIVAADVLTKFLAETYLVLHTPTPVIGDAFRLTLAYNTGAAFGMSLGGWSRVVFGAFAVFALVILYQLFRGSTPGERLKPLATGLAWGGAAGNLIDRLRSPRGVVDFIDVGIGTVRFWTFNVADSAVTVGAILLGWIIIQEDRRAKQA